MKQDIIIIHGGNTFETNEEYLAYLKNKEISRERLKFQGWKTTLNSRLGVGFEVFNPEMPNKNNAKYSEWKIWFERLIPLMHPNVILIGHSLGGIFLTKFLSEESILIPIKVTLIIAAPFGIETKTSNSTSDFYVADFVLSDNFDKLKGQSGKIFLLYSKDDQVVDFLNFEKFHEALPEAETILFEDRGHFNQTEFPELEDLIRTLVS